MAHPKRRQSKARTRKRRTHYKLDAPNVIACSNCGSPTLFHRVCNNCGHYRGKVAIEKDIVV